VWNTDRLLKHANDYCHVPVRHDLLHVHGGHGDDDDDDDFDLVTATEARSINIRLHHSDSQATSGMVTIPAVNVVCIRP